MTCALPPELPAVSSACSAEPQGPADNQSVGHVARFNPPIGIGLADLSGRPLLRDADHMRRAGYRGPYQHSLPDTSQA